MNVQSIVVCTMRPGCLYRASDIAAEAGLKNGQARAALGRLARGGVVGFMKNKGERRKVWFTRQERMEFDR